ncbi:MAG TPA: C45 family autoproteolytic acyltransferase/hydrolase [Candidatus Paceibacterota bacterium]|nr:C45 family autoproteolytic acyltransferase/hydrolase [Candidatus Paceibacterota bacterium]HSA01718.1 C45 family autoproteolytic acyltransferase/hydrolase [Candidatus Paceibacterota bacterium]
MNSSSSQMTSRVGARGQEPAGFSSGRQYVSVLYALVAIVRATATGSLPAEYLSTGFPQVVVVSGSDREMGLQYGEQAAAAIAHNVALFKSRLYDKYGAAVVAKDMQAWNYYLIRYDRAYQDWLEGIRAGCKRKGFSVSYDDLLMLVVYPAELWSRPTGPYPKETGVARLEPALVLPPSRTFHSCNTFAATGTMTSDGKPVHGITSMVATECMDSVILLAFPKRGFSFVSQAYAGKVNSNFAMNNRGLAWTMTAIQSDTPAWGVAPEVLFHYLAQFPGSLAEALDYLKSTPKGGCTGGFILTDGSGSIAVYEGTGSHFDLRKPGDSREPGQFVVQANHLVNPSLASLNAPWLNESRTTNRYETVWQFLKEAPPRGVDFTFAKRLFASDDWNDAAIAIWHRNEPGKLEVSNSHESVGQAIFFPADLTAYLQTGVPSGAGLPAYATGEYVKIKLAPRDLLALTTRSVTCDFNATGFGIPAASPRWAIPVMILDREVHLLLWTKSHASWTMLTRRRRVPMR